MPQANQDRYSATLKYFFLLVAQKSVWFVWLGLDVGLAYAGSLRWSADENSGSIRRAKKEADGAQIASGASFPFRAYNAGYC